ncbi:MAG: TonB-dependent receptor [Rhodocyclaceae bacterium]|nr:TonB-dependent receptor [Rhodocyclaceae bacterium]
MRGRWPHRESSMHHHPFKRAALALAVFATFPLPALADSANEPIVVVTATRMPTRVSEILSDVTVVTREDIDRTGNATLPEILGSLPGVQINTNGGRGATGSISIRGSNSNHVLVLVDGQRVSSATTGTTAIEHLPADQIERIEVLRGPASSLYGADAVGGVIQIFTRRGEGRPAPTLSLGIGRYGTVNASAAYGGQTGDTRFHVQLGQERSSGFGSIKEAKGGAFDMYHPDSDSYDNRNLSAHVSHRISSDLSVGGDILQTRGFKHFDAASCSPTFPWPCTPNFDSRQQQNLESASAFVDYRVSSLWKTSLRAGQSQDKTRSWMFDPLINVVSVERYDTRQNQVTWQNDVSFAGGKLMAALEWRNIAVSSTQPFTVKDQTSKALVLGYQAWFGDHSVQASARRDSISRLGSHNTGSLAYGYRFAPNWVARASIGSAYHAPTFNDLYWPLDLVSFFQGNPNLKPERARSRELGLNYDATGTTAGVTLYQNVVTDLINYVAATAAPWIGQNENLSKARIKGATFQYARTSGVWDWKASYDVLNARDTATGRTLQRRAPRSGSLDVRRHFDRFDIGAQLVATSARFSNNTNTQTLSGYGVVNVDANYRLDKDWTLFGRISNLGDKDYVEVRSTLTPFNEYAVAGRSLFVGIRYAPK